jgi:outer membrane protein
MISISSCLIVVSQASGQTPPVQPKVTEVPNLPRVEIQAPSSPINSLVAKPITVAEAAQIALKLSPTLSLARAQILLAEGKLVQTKAAERPTLGLTSGYSYVTSISTGNRQTSGSSGQSTGFTSNLSANQLLFDFNHTLDLVRQELALRKSAEENLTRSQQDLILAVKTAFYTLVQNQQLVTVQEANLASRNASLDLARARLNAGLGTPADVETAVTNVGDASVALSSARAAVLSSQISLAALIGIDPRTPLTPASSEEVAPESEDLNALADTAILHRPELRQYRQALLAGRYETRAAKSTNMPSIGASVGLGSRGTSKPFVTPSTSIGLSIGWSFLDGGKADGLRKQGEADIQTAEANLTAASLQIRQDIVQAYVSLKTAEQRVLISTSEVANAQESLRLAEGRFRAGIGLFVDITTAQATLVNARTQLINAQISIQQARASMIHAIGK